jgi:flagellar hook-associated protein 2
MTSVSGLSSTFTSLITSIMAVERQPLVRMQQQRDTLNVRSGAYSDVDTKLNSLLSAVQALKSTSLYPALVAGRSGSVTNAPTGYTVLTASTSSTAAVGAYDVAVDHLARAQRVRSDQQLYSDQALNRTGTFLIGGAASRSQSTVSTIADTVTAFDTNAPLNGQQELGNGSYYVETRNDPDNGWQFRLVNSEGKAVSIKDGTTTEYTTGWQSITAGTFDTGRGLKIDFGANSSLYQAADRSSGAAQVNYTAQGASISVEATDSLNAIAAKINDGTYGEGSGVVASVVDRQLVLTSSTTGASHTISAQDSSGTVLQSLGVLTGTGTYKNVMQTALDAVFTVNGLSVTRSQNTGLTDVITGVTLNLAADSPSKSATLNVSSDMTAAKSAIQTFIDQMNSVQTYLEEKTAITSFNDGISTTYTRGTLADDNVFGDLRSDLFMAFMNPVTSGTYQSLRDIGLTINDSLQVTISDSSKLETALSTNLDGVTALMDQVMGTMESKLTRFTGVSGGETGYLDQAISNFSTELSGMNLEIKDMSARLNDRELYLSNQYAQLQAQLINMSYTQQMLGSMYGSTSRSY